MMCTGLMIQVTWRPLPLSIMKVDPLAQPQIHSSAIALTDVNGNSATPTKPAGAYRPPHARGTATPAAFKREDEGGIPHTNGTQNGVPSRDRVVPGLAPAEPKEEKKRSRKKKDKSEKLPTTDHMETTPTAPPVATPTSAPENPGVSQEDIKKQRALLKKLRAIEELKLRQASGEKLEKTQEQKIEKEMEIVQELARLGITE